MTDTTPIPPPAADPRTPHLNLPLPAPNHNGQRTDVARIADAISKLDATLKDMEALILALEG